jgi:hypothetical protein
MDPWGSARQFLGVVQNPPAQSSAATSEEVVKRMVKMVMMEVGKRMVICMSVW